MRSAAHWVRKVLDPSWFNMAAKWSALALKERIEKAKKLFERSQNLEKLIEGLSKLKRKILAEVNFLKSVRIIINQPTYNCSSICMFALLTIRMFFFSA